MAIRSHQIAVEDVVETPRERCFEIGEAWWNERRLPGLEVEYDWEEQPRFDLRLYRSGETLHLEGRLEATLSVACSRCASRYRHALREDCRLVLSPAGERTPAACDPEGAEALQRDGLCLGDELDLGWYRGTQITLDDWFCELISLALPVQPLCDEACPGLCPHCGIDRRRASCDCEEKERRRRSPFAVLADWRPEESPRGGPKESGEPT